MCFFFFLFAIFHLGFQNKVFLNLLLVFEALNFVVFSVCTYVRGVNLRVAGFNLCLLLLCLGVAETVIALALLVRVSRRVGKGQVLGFSSLKF